MTQAIRLIDFSSSLTIEQHLQNIESDPEVKLEVSDYLLINPELDLENAKYYTHFWNIVAITASIGFTVLCLAGLVYLSSVNPDLLPYAITAIAALYIYPITSLYGYFKTKSIFYENIADASKGTLDKIRQLERLTNTQLMLKLYEINPRWNQSMEVRRLFSKIDPAYFRAYIPVIARHEYWKSLVVRAHLNVQHYLNEAQAMRTTKGDGLSQNERERLIRKKHKKAYKIQEMIETNYRIQTAFLAYVLENPLKLHETTSALRKHIEISYFGKMQPLKFSHRQWLRMYENHEEEKDPYFIKHDGHKIGRDWILNHSYQEIAKACFTS